MVLPHIIPFYARPEIYEKSQRNHQNKIVQPTPSKGDSEGNSNVLERYLLFAIVFPFQ